MFSFPLENTSVSEGLRQRTGRLEPQQALRESFVLDTAETQLLQQQTPDPGRPVLKVGERVKTCVLYLRGDTRESFMGLLSCLRPGLRKDSSQADPRARGWWQYAGPHHLSPCHVPRQWSCDFWCLLLWLRSCLGHLVCPHNQGISGERAMKVIFSSFSLFQVSLI